MIDKKPKPTTDTVATENVETAATTTEKPEVDGKEVKLLNGRKAFIMRPLGHIFMKAQRMAKHPSEIISRMVCMVTTIDGEKITLNDLKSMDAADLMKLTGNVGGYHKDDEDDDEEDDDDFLSPDQNI